MITDINSEDRLVQQTFADHLHQQLGWDSIYAYNAETFGPNGTLGRANEREVVLTRDLRAALALLNPGLPESAREQAIEKLTRVDFARSPLQHNREFYGFIRGGVPVEWRDAKGETHHALAQVIDFRNPSRNRFLAVRELKVQGVRVPHYNRRADLICFVNGRANRVYPGKDCGVIVDYNGMLKSLREALAQYATSDEDETGGGDIVAPIEELVAALMQAIQAAESHLSGLGFNSARLIGAKGFTRIEALRDAVDALYTSDEARRRFEIIARQVFIRFKALLMEPSVFAYAERHDNIEALYKKLQEKRDTADVTEVLKELHKIVNEAIRAQKPGGDHAEGMKVDLSRIDFVKLRDEFASKVKLKHAALRDIREVVEKKLAQMLAANPMRMDYYKKYQEIIADYNREKDRATVEDTFAKVLDLANSLDAEQRRAAEEGLSDDELALFDLLFKANISKANRERLKQASRALLISLQALLKPMPTWTQNTTTQAEVKVFILDNLWQSLPRPPFTDEDADALSDRVYDYVWQRSASGGLAESGLAA